MFSEELESFSSPNYPSVYSNSYSASFVVDVSIGIAAVYFYDFETESCCDKVTLR